eukprot:Nitzschia sp. Nitz4//scaffold398_size17708//9046//10800//NITZ4_008805-RA/size17708-augustus-gene-0.23-mRNA-1//-1//CDS//3329550309//6155//frame0
MMTTSHSVAVGAWTVLNHSFVWTASTFTKTRPAVCLTRRLYSATSPTMASQCGVALQEPLLSRLNDPTLLTDWAPTSSDTFDVVDPARPDSRIAQVPSLASAVQDKMQESHEILKTWRDETTAMDRSQKLQAWSSLMTQNAQDLALIMTLESGKPLAESMGEVNYAKSFLDFYAAEAIRSTNAGGGTLIPTPFADASTGKPKGTIMAKHQAVGMTAMITPWNFPAAMITRKVGPALAAGCSAVVKPSELTPLSAIALSTLAVRAGIPEAVFQVVPVATPEAAVFGTAVCENPLVRKISFTGSTKVGKWLMNRSSDHVKRLSLELGGNAPFVVFEDADLDQAVQAAMASKFRNAGQTCVCADRFLVHASVQDAFVEKLMKAMQSSLVMGHGAESGVTLGPLISTTAVDTVASKVETAIEQGAVCHVGGSRAPEMGPQYYQATILTKVTGDMDIWKTETFGPVVAIRTFQTDEQALEMANDATVGLAAYFCTKDMGRAFRFGDSLECGILGINEGVISYAGAPFGGVKESGLGREGSPMGLAEYLETKYVFLNY